MFGYKINAIYLPPFNLIPPEPEKQEPLIMTYQPKVIELHSLEPRLKIYSPNDIANVSFVVKNTLGVPYNITVDWFLNNTVRFHGWFNHSTELYNVTNQVNTYASWYPIKDKGHWKVQVLVKFKDLANNTHVKEATTEFDVI